MRIIAGTHKNRLIASPKGKTTRPTSSQLRESLFNICQHKVEGSVFLDLFAGSGAMGLEALSRGAKEAFFVESSYEGVQCIKRNVAAMGFERQAKIFKNDVFKIVHKFIREKVRFDVIYADPPYEMMTHEGEVKMSFSERVLVLVDQGDLLLQGGLLFIEDAKSVKLEVELSHLTRVDSRPYGRSVLHQYQKGSR